MVHLYQFLLYLFTCHNKIDFNHEFTFSASCTKIVWFRLYPKKLKKILYVVGLKIIIGFIEVFSQIGQFWFDIKWRKGQQWIVYCGSRKITCAWIIISLPSYNFLMMWWWYIRVKTIKNNTHNYTHKKIIIIITKRNFSIR